MHSPRIRGSRGRVHPDLPSRRLPRPRGARVRRAHRAAGRATAFAGYLDALAERRAYFIAERSRVGRPRRARAVHRRTSTTRRPHACSTAARAGTIDARRGPRLPRTDAARDGQDERRRRAGDDDPPGRAAQPPHRDLRALRAGHRPRHPRRHRVGRATCGRCCSASAPTRGCTSSCSPSTRPATRASSHPSPASTRACSSARRGGSSTPRMPCCASAPPRPRRPASLAARASSTTRARSSPSRRGTTWRADSMPRSWPGWSARVGSTSPPPSGSRATWSTSIPRTAWRL